MRKFISLLVLAASLMFGSVGLVQSAPVPGNADYVTLYNTMIVSCTARTSTPRNCELAIAAYTARLIADAVPIAAANVSFSEARREIFAINAPMNVFQAQIDALFEQLLPESGSIGAVAGATGIIDPSPSL